MIRYFDMFAGVGGFRAGLTRAGGFACVGHSEIDRYADASYRAIHNPKESEVFYADARTIEPDDLPDFDLLCGGFPCQAFSLAGKRRGFEDGRGTLFFELARIAAAKRPPYLLFENVPGILSHDQGKTFACILDTLCELGYGVEWLVLNSKDHGVPQSRRRVFIVGFLDKRCAGKILPYREANPASLVRMAGRKQGYTLYDSEGLACTQTSNTGGFGGKTGLYFIDSYKSDLCGISSTLRSRAAIFWILLQEPELRCWRLCWKAILPPALNCPVNTPPALWSGSKGHWPAERAETELHKRCVNKTRIRPKIALYCINVMQKTGPAIAQAMRNSLKKRRANGRSV